MVIPLLLLACAPEPTSSAPSASCTGTCVDWDGDALSLLEEDRPLLRLSLEGIELGLVTAYEEGLSYDPWFDLSGVRWRAPTEALASRDADGALLLELTYGDEATACLEVGPAAEGRFAMRLSPTGGDSLAAVRLSAEIDPNEGVYGLGEFFDTVDQQGQRRPLQIEVDGTLESLYNEAHVPIPFALGTSGWGLFVEDRHPMVVDVGATTSGRMEWTVGLGPEGEEGLAFHLFAEADPLDLVGDYYRTTGFPVLPDPWALGPLLWRDENTGQAQVEEDIGLIRSLDLPASGIWIDRPYASGVNTFDFEPEDYPDPKAMIDYAHEQGLRVGVWHTPYVSADDAPELNAEATANGYFPPGTGVNLNGWGTPLDFSNPAAMAWWQDQIAAYTELGIEGYKLDYGEDIVVGLGGGLGGWRFDDGTDARTMHKRYAALYHQAYAETLPETGGFLLCRASTWGDQAHARIIWPGDLAADLSRHRDPIEGEGSLSVGGLSSAVNASLSLGASGFPFFGSDTGGYRRSPPSRETLLRWVEHTALSAVMQVGNSANGQPWELLEGEDLDLYRELSRLHLRLFPTLWSYAAALQSDGRPIARHVGLAFPEIRGAPAEEYLLGDWLLVAPVIDEGATSREVVFPPGQWIDWFSLEVFEGDQTTVVEAPVEKLPLYLGEGGIVALLRSTIDTLAAVADPEEIDSFAADPGVLTLRIFPGPSSSFTLYDGTVVAQAGGEIELDPGEVFTQGMSLEIVGSSATAATVDGNAADLIDEDGIVRLSVGPGSHSIVLE